MDDTGEEPERKAKMPKVAKVRMQQKKLNKLRER